MNELININIHGLVLYEKPLVYTDKIYKFTGMSVLDTNVEEDIKLNEQDGDDNKDNENNEDDMLICADSDSSEDSVESVDSENKLSKPVELTTPSQLKKKLNTKSHFAPDLKLQYYSCLGDIQLGEGFDSNTFRLWTKDMDYYVEILYDADPDYFIRCDKDNLESSINECITKYNVKHVGSTINMDSILYPNGSHPNGSHLTQPKEYNIQTISLEQNNNEIIFYMGLIDDIGAFENSIVMNRLTNDIPLSYSNPDEYPVLSAFKTKFSGSFIEFYTFTRFNINGHYPLMCRCVYDGDTIPIDVLCFKKNHLVKELDEYINYVKNVYCKDDEAFLPLVMEIYLTLSLQSIDKFLDEVNPQTDNVKQYFSVMKTNYNKLKYK